jgi:predicted PurR-regulated permease PerM
MELNEHTVHISAGTIIKTIIIVLLFGVAFVLKNLLLVVLMAIVVASAIEPATQWLVRKKIPRLLSIILIYLGMALFLFAVVYFLMLPLLSESTDFLKNFPTYFNSQTISNTIAQNGFLSSQPIASLQSSFNLGPVIDSINNL